MSAIAQLCSLPEESSKMKTSVLAGALLNMMRNWTRPSAPTVMLEGMSSWTSNEPVLYFSPVLQETTKRIPIMAPTKRYENFFMFIYEYVL